MREEISFYPFSHSVHQASGVVFAWALISGVVSEEVGVGESLRPLKAMLLLGLCQDFPLVLRTPSEAMGR